MFEAAVDDRAGLIDFDAPAVDLAVCPKNCPERHYTAHLHCVSDGRLIEAHSSDGRGITDYDGYECSECKEAVCTSCAVEIDGTHRCPNCTQEVHASSDLVVANLENARLDVHDARVRLSYERDPRKLAAIGVALMELQQGISLISAEYARKRVCAA